MKTVATLKVTLPSDREIMLTRAFDAPRRLVWEAFTKPELLKKWWGLKVLSMTVCNVDLRVGGAWRFVLRGPDGQEHPFTGVYKEINSPEKIVQTFIYDVDGIRDFPAVETIQFEERDGKTLLKSIVLHQSKEARDGHIASGMEEGSAESFDRLAELLKTSMAA